MWNIFNIADKIIHGQIEMKTHILYVRFNE